MTAFPSSPPEQEKARPRGQRTSPGTGLLTGPVRKLLLIAGLLLCTLIAGAPISRVIDEREARQASVLAEFKQSWGPEQVLRSPILAVPFQPASGQTASGQQRQYLKIAPSRLKAKAVLAPEERHRGLFHATVYNAAVELEGTFTIPDGAKLDQLFDRSSKASWGFSFAVPADEKLNDGMARHNKALWAEGFASPVSVTFAKALDKAGKAFWTEGFAIDADPELNGLLAKNSQVFWPESFVILEASSLAGITPDDRLTWNGGEFPWQNCWDLLSKADECQQTTAVLARPKLSLEPAAGAQIPFRATINLRGTSALRMLFQGKDLEANIAAPWATPSFNGNLLPASSTITAQDFEARWKAVSYTTPQFWRTLRLGEIAPSSATSLGVELLDAVPTYRIIHRASKYGMLFVILAFTTYFLFEILSTVRIHAVQYGLLGASLTLFALLLISFSEPLGYTLGYAISAGLVLLQATVYTAAVARRLTHAALFGAMLATLFGFLYVLLSLETYSMLAGALGLFVVLSVVMAITQRVDWQGEGETAQARD